MTDTTTTPRKRGRPRLTQSDAERAERIRVYQRDYGLKRRAKNAEAIRAYAREHRAARMRENPEAVLEAEREASRRSRAKRRIEPVRSADRDRIGRFRRVPRPADVGRPLLAGRGRPPLVEQDQRAPLGYGRHDRRAFLGPPFIGQARPRFADLANIDAGEACAPGTLPEPLEVAIEQQALWPRLQSAHANQREAHVQISAASALGGFARPIGAPHLLKVIEPANVRTENVYDRILRIEQHPIAQRHSLNFR